MIAIRPLQLHPDPFPQMNVHFRENLWSFSHWDPIRMVIYGYIKLYSYIINVISNTSLFMVYFTLINTDLSDMIIPRKSIQIIGTRQ